MTHLALVLALAATLDPALAEARRFSDAGKLQYELGRFEEARESYERAYAEKPLPAFLFNIGQCHFQRRRFDQALFFYERYLELEPKAENRAVILELIAEARAGLAAAGSAGTAQPTLPPLVRGAPHGPTPESPVADEIPWLWVGVGGAAVAVASGAVLLWMLGSSAEEAQPTLGVLDRSGRPGT
jgi:tetratricopeptide (TPR) repeat protein